MRTIQREGLANALREFGVDSAPHVMMLGDFGIPTLQLQDLTFNYEPALRARIMVNISTTAPGANLHQAASLQAGANGLWLRTAAHTFASGSTLIRVATSKLVTIETSLVTGITVGSSQGQIIDGTIGGTSQRLLPYAMFGTIPTAGLDINGRLLDPRMAILEAPLWIPAFGFLVVVNPISNASLTCTFDLMIPSASAGPWTP